MGSIGLYLFRTTLGALLLVLATMTGVIWVSYALREIDLVTNQGQTVLVFLAMTALFIPQLVFIIAPIALVVAIAFVLHKLDSDSELVVMNAAGLSPWRLLRPFVILAVLVSIVVAVIGAYVAPLSIRTLRAWATQVRAEIVTNIVQPGRFISIDRGLTFHIRERRADGQLAGILVDDRRKPGDRMTLLAERGSILENDRGTFLLLEAGSIHRHEAGERDAAVVLFDRYAYDLSRLSGNAPVTRYSVRERYLWDLADPDPNDPLFKSQPGQFRAEFNDRIFAPLYPLAFTAIVFAILGVPRPARQTRMWSIALVAAALVTLRLAGFGAVVIGVQTPFALAAFYVVLAAAMALGLLAIANSRTAGETPLFLQAAAAFAERLTRRAAAR